MLKRFLRRFFTDVSCLPLAWLTFVIPRRSESWCFGACQGDRYTDHSRMLFEEIIEHVPEIQAFWSTRSREVYRELKARKVPVVKSDTLKGFYCTARAGVCFYTHPASDHNRPAAHGAFRVQLWHGIPLKRIGRDSVVLAGANPLRERGITRGIFLELKKIQARIFPWANPKWDLFVFQSEIDRARTGSAFRGSFSRGRVLGSIRAEWLSRQQAQDDNQSAQGRDLRILYAPTHRRLGHDRLFERVPVPDRSRFEAMLEYHGASLEVRMHPAQKEEVIPEGLLSAHIDIRGDELLSDVYTSLASCDVLVTDYSSVFIDAVGAGIPVVCLAPDRDHYSTHDQGFYQGLEEFPGPVVDTWEEALNACRTVCDAEEERWRQARETARDFYFDSDIKSTEGAMSRVVAAVRSPV